MHFREWIQTHVPQWSLVWDRPHPRYSQGPRDRWSVAYDPLPSTEGWPVIWIWIWSTLLTLTQQARRHRHLSAAVQALDSLRERLASPRTRPTTEQILRLFSLAERHTLLQDGRTIQLFQPVLTDLQQQVLDLLGVPENAFQSG